MARSASWLIVPSLPAQLQGDAVGRLGPRAVKRPRLVLARVQRDLVRAVEPRFQLDDLGDCRHLGDEADYLVQFEVEAADVHGAQRRTWEASRSPPPVGTLPGRVPAFEPVGLFGRSTPHLGPRRRRPEQEPPPRTGPRAVLSAVVFGLGAALCFAAAALCATGASREIGAASTLGWVMALGMAMIVIPLALSGHPDVLTGRTIGLLCVAGVGNIVGLLLEYVVLRHVAVGIVTAVASTEGMVAAVLSSVFGAPLAARTVVLLVVTTARGRAGGRSLRPSRDPAVAGTPSGRPRLLGRLDVDRTRSSLLLVPVALMFGVTLYAIGRAGTEAPLIWVLRAGTAVRNACHRGPSGEPPQAADQPAGVSDGPRRRTGRSGRARELHLRRAARASGRRRHGLDVRGCQHNRRLLLVRRPAAPAPARRDRPRRGGRRDPERSRRVTGTTPGPARGTPMIGLCTWASSRDG